MTIKKEDEEDGWEDFKKTATKEDWQKFAPEVLNELRRRNLITEETVSNGSKMVAILLIGGFIFAGIFLYLIYTDHFKAEVNMNPSYETNLSIDNRHTINNDITNPAPKVEVYSNTTVNNQIVNQIANST